MWRQLRWRLVGAQILVVIVGVLALLLAANLALRNVPGLIHNLLSTLAPDLAPAEIEQTAQTVTDYLQQIMMRSLPVAALAATAAGLVASLLPTKRRLF